MTDSLQHLKIAVVGLGYVGLPVALALAKKFKGVVGFDIKERRVDDLRRRVDETGEAAAPDFEGANIHFTSSPGDLAGCNFFVVAVPTPIDRNNRPDLRPLNAASKTIGKHLRPGAIIVYESTVYPGMTEEYCGPILEQTSGLKQGTDFKLGYSPERINPGDREHSLERVTKIVAGEDMDTLEMVAAVYGKVVSAGVHRAESIKVAEAAKVIENTQRDLNIALMNEFALIFDRIGIRTMDVLRAAGTKWNFLPFRPGLVGGHCIGVDPYYLTTKAEELGYHPQVILSGRRINDAMGPCIAQRVVKMLAQSRRSIASARVAVLGLTFKENVPDLRNSKVPDVVAELREFGVEPLVHDSLASRAEAKQLYDISLCEWADLVDLDAIVLAVTHSQYLEHSASGLLAPLRPGGVIVDIKSALKPSQIPPDALYWSL